MSLSPLFEPYVQLRVVTARAEICTVYIGMFRPMLGVWC